MQDRPTDAQYKVLETIRRLEGRASYGSVAKALRKSKNTVVKHVAALVKLGLVVKRDPSYDTLRVTEKAL